MKRVLFPLLLAFAAASYATALPLQWSEWGAPLKTINSIEEWKASKVAQRAVPRLGSGGKYALAEEFKKAMEESTEGEARNLQSCSPCYQFLYDGTCGGFADKSSRWGDWELLGYCVYDTCCASSEGDCCDPNGGAIAGAVIGVIALIAIIVIASCACCKCCPLYDKMCCAPKDGGANTMAPVQAPVQATAAGQVTTTETIQPDGTKVIETITTQPDGTKVVETATTSAN